jgi:hypothetical protein
MTAIIVLIIYFTDLLKGFSLLRHLQCIFRKEKTHQRWQSNIKSKYCIQRKIEKLLFGLLTGRATC